MLWLPGAGGRARAFLSQELQGQAEAAGMLLLVPTSKEYTWDVIVGRGRYGPDVAVIDRALKSMFSHYAIDPTHVASGGFSDGASYALSLGVTNGDLFTYVLAFSPGFMMPAGAERLSRRLRLPRHPRRSPPDRALQPQNRPAAQERWLRC
jgi:phospholipase/carboxylesterase